MVNSARLLGMNTIITININESTKRHSSMQFLFGTCDFDGATEMEQFSSCHFQCAKLIISIEKRTVCMYMGVSLNGGFPQHTHGFSY